MSWLSSLFEKLNQTMEKSLDDSVYSRAKQIARHLLKSFYRLREEYPDKQSQELYYLTVKFGMGYSDENTVMILDTAKHAKRFEDDKTLCFQDVVLSVASYEELNTPNFVKIEGSASPKTYNAVMDTIPADI